MENNYNEPVTDEREEVNADPEDSLYSDGYFPEDTMEPLFPEDEEQPAPKKKKKKKRTLKRILRGLGKYIASLPARTLIITGCGIVLVIALIAALIILLPGKEKQADPALAEPGPQLAIADPVDAEPTPTIEPLTVPETLPEEPTPTPGPVIKEGGIQHGDTDDLVPGIQERLAELGYMKMPEGGYTNKYGSATRNAIRRFQCRHFENYKDWDGVVGQKTYELLFSDEAKPFFMKNGDTDASLYDGTLVTLFQTDLKTLGYLSKVTGKYDEDTKAAVAKFQTDHGLDADGVAGATTLEIVSEEIAGTYVAPTPVPPSVTAEPNPVEEPETAAEG